MKIYSVGGCVRDMLLRRQGRPVPEGDRDWVVVGETPEAMIRRGFLPVGNDFPVFLHPRTHEEYALARTERKTAPGYHGFVFHAAPDVTLEEDLARRDLTVNAIALDSDGTLIDPYGGMQDLERGILRHVSSAFREDPVRILRAARFAARFPDFSIHSETLALMQEMVRSGEADALMPERVIAELIKGLETSAPCRMLDVLIACGLWQRLFGTVRLTAFIRASLHRAHLWDFPQELLLALLACGAQESGKPGEAARSFLSRLRASAPAQELARLLASGGLDLLLRVNSAEDAIALLRHFDALRKRERMEMLLRCRKQVLANACCASTDDGRLMSALEAWTGIDAGSIARSAPNPREIPQRILAARTLAVQNAWNSSFNPGCCALRS